jgi:hypothetical protein
MADEDGDHREATDASPGLVRLLAVCARRLGDVPPELVEQREPVIRPRGRDSGQERREGRGCTVAAAVSSNCGEGKHRFDLGLGQRARADSLRERLDHLSPFACHEAEVTGEPR